MAIEHEIREALKKRVESYGGEVRAIAYIGRAHCPDVLVLCGPNHWFVRDGHCVVEVKGTEVEPRPGQLREHERLNAAGIFVKVINSLEKLDQWLPPKKQ